MRNLERNRLLDPSGRKQRSKLDLRATVPTKRLIGAMILLNYKADWTCALVAAIAAQEITGRDCWPTRIRHFVRQFSKFRTIEHIESTWEIWNWVRLNPPRDRLVQPERGGSICFDSLLNMTYRERIAPGNPHGQFSPEWPSIKSIQESKDSLEKTLWQRL